MMKEIDLLNKRILYYGVIKKRHYDTNLIDKLTERGAIVDSYNYIPYSIYYKTIRELKLPNLQRYTYNYYDQMLLKRDYDFVLIRMGMQLDAEFLTRLRKLNPNAKFINFHWDSLRSEYNYLNIIKYFDKVYSFDYKDCKEHPEIQYLPLFYIDEYETFRKNKFNKDKKYDVLFIGKWKNYERYNLIKATKNLCKQNQLRFYYYLQQSIQGQIVHARKGIISYEAKCKYLSHREILNLFSLTNAVIDFPSSYQTGLTMRAIETLGAGEKLITTNKNIINEPFYNPEYINIIDINNLKLDIDFIRNTPTSSIEEQIDNYSLKNYINQLLR